MRARWMKRWIWICVSYMCYLIRGGRRESKDERRKME